VVKKWGGKEGQASCKESGGSGDSTTQAASYPNLPPPVGGWSETPERGPTKCHVQERNYSRWPRSGSTTRSSRRSSWSARVKSGTGACRWHRRRQRSGDWPQLTKSRLAVSREPLRPGHKFLLRELNRGSIDPRHWTIRRNTETTPFLLRDKIQSDKGEGRRTVAGYVRAFVYQKSLHVDYVAAMYELLVLKSVLMWQMPRTQWDTPTRIVAPIVATKRQCDGLSFYLLSWKIRLWKLDLGSKIESFKIPSS